GFELYCQLLKQSVASQKGEKVKPRIEVQVRLDFLALSPVEEVRGQSSEIRDQKSEGLPRITQHASAAIPFKYISDARQRIEIYRKLAQAADKAALQALEKEVRD